MLQSLRRINLYKTATIDRVFKTHAGETARGIRLIAKDMDLESLKFKNYIEIKGKLFENEALEVDLKNRYIDVYFPPLEVGSYPSELLIYDGEKLLKSGTFIIEVDSGGNEVIGDVKHLSENELVINFTYEFSGSAILN